MVKFKLLSSVIEKWYRKLRAAWKKYRLLPPLAQALDITIDALFALPEEHAPLLYIEEVPWDNDEEYRLALFRGKVLLNRQTHLCRRGGSLIAHIQIPEGGE